MFCVQSVSQFSRSVVSNSLRPHGLQHSRPPCASLTPGVHSNSCPSSRWCHPAISSSVIPFSSCLQSFPASGQGLFKWVSLLHSVSDHLLAFLASRHLPVLTGIPEIQNEAWGLVCGNSRDFLFFLWLIASQPQPHRRGRSFMHMNASTVYSYPAFAGSQLVDKLLNAKLQ